MGKDAGLAVTAGANNTFVGALSGDAVDDGGNNVAVGYGSLSANCGDSNTAVGYGALSAVLAGHQNVGISSGAGDAITSGSNNICIGYNTDPGAGDAAYQIVLGDSITGGEDNQFTFGKASNTMRNEFDSDEDVLQVLRNTHLM